MNLTITKDQKKLIFSALCEYKFSIKDLASWEGLSEREKKEIKKIERLLEKLK